MRPDAGPNAALLEHFRLPCGCDMEIARDRITSITLTRTIHRRHQSCASRTHRPGERVYLWELLPRMVARS